jgi:hypothetical protein
MVRNRWRDIELRIGKQDSFIKHHMCRYLYTDEENCNRVFKKWFVNGGSEFYALTWKGLYDLLCSVGYPGVANKVKHIISENN